MKLDVFVLAWNEERLINQFLDWYSFARVTVLNNFSTDRTVPIAMERGCNIINYGSMEQNNEYMTRIKQDCWKESTADWVIVCDMDEFLFHPRLLKLLDQTTATVIKSEGYQMISEESALAKDVKYGSREPGLDKSVCFKPSSIREMNWEHGCHKCYPVGNVRVLENTVKLLHYSMLGRESMKNRWAQYRRRMSEWDVLNGAGAHYTWSDERIDATFDSYKKTAIKVW